MSLTKFSGATNNIRGLADKPTQSALQLKTLFDKTGDDLKTYINETLTTEIDAALGTKADATQTDTKISSEFQYQDVAVLCPGTTTSSPLSIGDQSFTIPTGYELFTASIIGISQPIGTASILSLSSNRVFVTLLVPFRRN